METAICETCKRYGTFSWCLDCENVQRGINGLPPKPDTDNSVPNRFISHLEFTSDSIQCLFTFKIEMIRLNKLGPTIYQTILDTLISKPTLVKIGQTIELVSKKGGNFRFIFTEDEAKTWLAYFNDKVKLTKVEKDTYLTY